MTDAHYAAALRRLQRAHWRRIIRSALVWTSRQRDQALARGDAPMVARYEATISRAEAALAALDRADAAAGGANEPGA